MRVTLHHQHTSPDAETVEALVDGMVQVFVETGNGASEDDLVRRGFSREAIAEHGPAAAAIARARFVRRIDGAAA